MRLIPFCPSPYGKLQALMFALDAMAAAAPAFYGGLVKSSSLVMCVSVRAGTRRWALVFSHVTLCAREHVRERMREQGCR